MILTGAMTVAAALAAAWLGFAPIPRLILHGKPRQTELRRMLVRWEAFSPAALGRARKLDRLILLSLTARWSPEGATMDGTTYADPDVAGLAEKRVVAVRVDADERPDLALRYMGKGWPTTALLLPTGEILADGTFMDAPTLRRWVDEIEKRFRSRRAGVYDAAAQAEAARLAQKPAGDPSAALERARGLLSATWRGPKVFPRYDRLMALTRLRAEWAPALIREGAAAARELQQADGGILRVKGSGEELLGDQADALSFLAVQDPEAAARLRGFVAKRLALPGGGYRASVWPGGGDGRFFADESARMAAAILGDPRAPKAQKEHALLTVEKLEALKTRPKDLLGDRLGRVEALLAAERPRHAQAAMGTLETLLLDEGGEAFYDRPKRGELFGGLDRIRFAGLNARARRLLLALGDRKRAQDVGRWLWEHPEGLDAADLAELAEERLR